MSTKKLTRPFLFFLVIAILVSLACQQSVAPSPQSAVDIVAKYPALASFPDIVDFIVKYPELERIVTGEEQGTVVAKVIRAGVPVILIASADEFVPVVGQADDIVIVAIIGLAAATYIATDLADQVKDVATVEFSASLAAGWTASTAADAFSELGLVMAAMSQGDWVMLEPSNFNLPQPPKDKCGIIEALLGQPCRWEVRQSTSQDGDTIIEVSLKAGDQLIARYQAMRTQLAAYEELGTALTEGAFHGSRTGWITFIETAKWLEGSGFGKLLWQAGDAVIKAISLQQVNEKAVHIFADHAGWGESLLKGIDTLTKAGERLWLYVVP